MKTIVCLLSLLASLPSWATSAERVIDTRLPPGITLLTAALSPSKVHEYLSTPALSEDEAASLLLKAWHGRSGAMAPAVPPALLTEALLPYMVRSGVCSGGVLEAGGLVCHIGNPVAPQRLAGVAVANTLQTTTPRLPDPASPLTRIYLKALSRQASHAAPTLLPASLSEADDHHGMLVVVRYAIKTATLSVAQLDIAAAHRQPVWR